MNQQKIKRKRGGQTLSADGTESVGLHLRISTADYEAAHKQAARLGVSISAFMRAAVIRHVKTIAKIEALD